MAFFRGFADAATRPGRRHAGIAQSHPLLRFLLVLVLFLHAAFPALANSAPSPAGAESAFELCAKDAGQFSQADRGHPGKPGGHHGFCVLCCLSHAEAALLDSNAGGAGIEFPRFASRAIIFAPDSFSSLSRFFVANGSRAPPIFL
jgi:hypothetical protein